MCPDLNLQPTLIDADNLKDLHWVYQGPPEQRPASIDLDDLPLEVDWTKKRMVWMIYGSCNVEVIERVLQRITECSQVVVVESEAPDAYHLDLDERDRLMQWVAGERLSIIVGGKLMDRADKLVQMINIDLLDGWKPLLSQALMAQRPEETRRLFERLGGGLNSKIMSKGTYLTVAQHYLRNTLINAPLVGVKSPLMGWAGTLTDRPVLLVAAGPSLDKQLPLLAKNQDLFTILAVNTVWRILDQHGIVPDAVLALDRNSKPAWPVNGVSPRTAFCVDLGCAPALMWSNDRNHVITACDPTIANLLTPMGASVEYLRTGGSVATTAFALAEHLGGNPIVLIGQDLALTDGRDHAEGYPHAYSDQVLKMRTDHGFDVDGYHGGRVRTERQLMYYKNWFEGRIRDLPHKMIINATEGGAKIEGALQLPFATVCEEIRATSLRKPGLMPEPAPQPRTIDPAYMQQLREGIAKLSENIKALEDLASRARTWCRKAGSKPSALHLRRIDKMNQRIREHEAHSKRFVDIMSIAKFEAIRYKTHIGDQMDGLGDAVAKYDEVYQNIEAGASAAREMLRTMDRFYARVAERGQIDLSLLDEVTAA